MKILFDSIFFEFAESGIARVWSSILEEWSNCTSFRNHELFILARSNNIPFYDSFNYIPFSRSYGFRFSGVDSLAIQDICDSIGIDVFISSYYSFPLRTKSVMMVYDMIPERFDFPMNEPGWLEKVAAIKHACAYICISHNTASDLIYFHPEIPESSVVVAHCGVDVNIFKQRSRDEVTHFLSKNGINYPYWIISGSRDQYNSYKNTRLLFEGIKSSDSFLPYGIVCTGGAPDLEDFVTSAQSKLKFPITRHHFDDVSLSMAYQASLGLVYPSLYEGFGMPVIEAMASACPVITTRLGSLKEAGGDAACYITGKSADELLQLMYRLMTDENLSSAKKVQGLLHIQKFKWKTMAEIVLETLCKVHSCTSIDGPENDTYQLRVSQATLQL